MTEVELKNMDTRDKLDKSFRISEVDSDKTSVSVQLENTEESIKIDIDKIGGANVPTKGTQKVLPSAVYDSAGDQVSHFGGIAVDAQDIAGNDTTTYADVAGFKAMADGSVTVVTAKGQTRVLQVFEGVMEAISITKFMATGSTVSSIRIYHNK